MGKVAGVDVGGAAIHALILEDGDKQLGSARLRTPLEGERGAVLDVLRATVHEALDSAGLGLDDLDAVGVGTPGVVIGGSVGGASSVPGWEERFGLAEMLEGQLGRPVRVVNDITAVSVGEHHAGAGRGHDHVLVVSIGTGVGAGLILDGRPFLGAVGGAGEFGHTVVSRGGAVCPCGRRGCVEAYAGRRAMALAAERAVTGGRTTVLFDVQREQRQRRLSAGVFAEALRRGDDLAADLIDEAVEALGAGIASAVNLLDVEAVVLGGTLVEALGEHFVFRIDAATRPHLFLQPPRVRLVRAALGDGGGALGAALLARATA